VGCDFVDLGFEVELGHHFSDQLGLGLADGFCAFHFYIIGKVRERRGLYGK
jgi:hypothetical protein